MKSEQGFAFEDNIPNSVEAFFGGIKIEAEKLGLKIEGASFLDVGSGDSKLVNIMKQSGIDAIGVDIRPRGPRESPQVQAKIEELPFKTESFDAVTAFGVFDPVYEQDQRRMIEEIIRVLKPGGLFFSLADIFNHKIISELKLVDDSVIRVFQKV